MNLIRQIRGLVRDIWRTLFLLGFAGQIYRDDEGSVYLVSLETSSARPPTHVWRIPSDETLERLVQESCWANTQFVLLGVSLALAFFALPKAWNWTAIFLFFVQASISGRGVRLVLAPCRDLPQEEWRSLVLRKVSDLVKLKHVNAISVGSLVLPAILAFVPTIARSMLGRDLPKDPESAVVWAIAATAILSGYLLLAGNRITYRYRLDLRAFALDARRRRAVAPSGPGR